MGPKICRKCLFREMDEATYKDMIEKHIRVLKENDRAEQALYDSRLSVCKECDKLIEATCMACGCYVEIRAAMNLAKCPHKKW